MRRHPVEYRGNQGVCLFVHPFIDQSVCPSDRLIDRWTDRLTRMHEFPPYLTRHRPLLARCPTYFKTVIAIQIDRERVPRTIHSLWATGLLFFSCFLGCSFESEKLKGIFGDKWVGPSDCSCCLPDQCAQAVLATDQQILLEYIGIPRQSEHGR